MKQTMEVNKMRKYPLICMLLLILILPANFGVLAQTDLSVAVLPFEVAGNVRLRWNEEDAILEGITQMVTDRLANEDDLILIERERIKEIMKEQGFQYSGAVDLSTAVEIGRLLGVDILVLGSLNAFSLEGRDSVSFGQFQVSGATANTQLSARLVGVESGRIFASIKAEGKETGLGLEVDEFKGFSMDSEEFEDSTMGKALDKAVTNFVQQFDKRLAEVKDKLTDEKGKAANGRVIAIRGNFIIVDLGAKDGIDTTTKFSVYRLEEIQGLSEPIRLPNGSLQVISVDQNAAVTQILTTSPSGLAIQVGDVVEVQD